jgi:hypothetical protein
MVLYRLGIMPKGKPLSPTHANRAKRDVIGKGPPWAVGFSATTT